MGEQKVIETGVDRLLSIIKKSQKVSISDAAKMLGVSEAVTEEWGDFLEDEGYIGKEFKLTKTIFIIKTLDTESITKKAEEFKGKKEAFVRKAEVAIAGLDQDGEVINSLHDQFEKLKKDIGEELKDMKVELQELERYELLKGDIDKKLKQQEDEFRKKIDSLNKEIQSEETKYQELLTKIESEKTKLEKEKADNLSIREEENALKIRLNDFFKDIEKIRKTFKESEHNIEDSDKTLIKLKNLSDEIQSDVSKKKSSIDNLLKENQECEKKIIAAQQELYTKIKEKKELFGTKEKKVSEDKFKSFFSQKGEIEALLADIAKDKDLLEKDLIELIKKAKAFNVTAKSKDVTKQVKELEDSYNKTEEKRKSYDEKMHTLSSKIGIHEKKKKRWFSF